jgi:hypothetical protein
MPILAAAAPVFRYRSPKPPAGLTQREWLEHDSNLDIIRDSLRFKAVMKRL